MPYAMMIETGKESLMKERKNKEINNLFHLVYLGVLTIFGLLLAVVGMIAGGEEIMVVLLVVISIMMWIAHFAQIASPAQRIYFYTIIATCFLMIYGSHQDSITDMPLVLCLLIIVLSVYEEIGLIYLIAISYPLMILHHVFVSRYINLSMDWIVLSRVILGVICVGVAVLLSRLFMYNRNATRMERDQLTAELAMSRKENENLLANVSHELRTPINAIHGMAELMLNGNLDSEMKRQMKDIHLASHRIYRQVSSILDYAEIATGKLKVSPHEYEVRLVVEHCVSDITNECNPKDLWFDIDIDEHVPNVLLGDEEKIIRVLMALLENAFKFTESGGVQLYVTCRSEEKYGVNLNVDIYDTGVGMSEEVINNLFRGAYKADSGSSQKTGGLGIGFMIASELIYAMNGFITVDSELGKGTHVHITLPQLVGEDIAREAEETEEKIKELYQSMRVLVVDDEPMNLKVVRGILRSLGVEAKIAEGGMEGLALCELEDFDLIFMDYMMPEMDGEEAMYRIRSARNGYYNRTPIVALTANAASGARQMFLDMGFDEFMAKPVDASSMERMLRKIAGGEYHE